MLRQRKIESEELLFSGATIEFRAHVTQPHEISVGRYEENMHFSYEINRLANEFILGWKAYALAPRGAGIKKAILLLRWRQYLKK